MKITYDSRQNVAYIRLGERRAEAGTLRTSDELNIDLASDGTRQGQTFILRADRLNFCSANPERFLSQGMAR